MKSFSPFLEIYINSFLLCFVSILSIFLKRKPGERLWPNNLIHKPDDY